MTFLGSNYGTTSLATVGYYKLSCDSFHRKYQKEETVILL